MSRKIRLINGKGDWTDVPPTGASDADLYQLANDFIAQAGVVDLAGNDALVTESDTPALSVKIKKGTIYVLNSAWVANSFEPRYYQVISDADEGLSISSNSSGNTRIDKICQKIDKITDPNDTADNVAPLVVVAGTPGSGAPATPSDHELLATITIPDGTTAIVNAMITDNRRQVYIDTKTVNDNFYALTDAATITVNLATKKRKFRVTLGGNRTIAFSNAKEGDTFLLRLTNDGTARNPVWPTNLTWFGIEDDPNMADYVDANRAGAFLFICTDATIPTFDAFFLGAVE